MGPASAKLLTEGGCQIESSSVAAFYSVVLITETRPDWSAIHMQTSVGKYSAAREEYYPKSLIELSACACRTQATIL